MPAKFVSAFSKLARFQQTGLYGPMELAGTFSRVVVEDLARWLGTSGQENQGD
jgi:hypothetical protein